MAYSPVIIIGMHRSGTTLIAKQLRGLGLFTGKSLDDNHEATFFTRHNAWMLSACGGRWDTPRCIEYLYAHTEGRELVVEYLRQRLSGVPSVEYLGMSGFLRYHSIFSINEPWGWKDPRTTVTLPVWLSLFPDARIIHVVRNGIDVAESLCRREQEGFVFARGRFEKNPWAARFRAKKGWFGTSPRVMDRREGFRLWEEYLEFAVRFTSSISNPVLEIRYEDFLSNPASQLSRLASFCGLPDSTGRIAKASRRVEARRAFAFMKNEDLVRLWNEVRASKWMVKYGYDNCDA